MTNNNLKPKVEYDSTLSLLYDLATMLGNGNLNVNVNNEDGTNESDCSCNNDGVISALNELKNIVETKIAGKTITEVKYITKEVPVYKEKIVTKYITKEVPVYKEVEKEVIKVVYKCPPEEYLYTDVPTENKCKPIITAKVYNPAWRFDADWQNHLTEARRIKHVG